MNNVNHVVENDRALKIAEAIRLAVGEFGGSGSEQIELLPFWSEQSPKCRFSALGRAALASVCAIFGIKYGLRWRLEYVDGTLMNQAAFLFVDCEHLSEKALDQAWNRFDPDFEDLCAGSLVLIRITEEPGRRFVVTQTREDGQLGVELGAADNLCDALEEALDLSQAENPLRGSLRMEVEAA